MGITIDRAGPQWTPLHPPDEITRDLFSRGRDIARARPLAADTLLAVALLALSSVWLAGAGFASPRSELVQAMLIAAVAVRRARPLGVFLLACAVAFAQWLLDFPLIGDGVLLICLYTVAAHESRLRAVLAAGLLEVGVFMAALKWEPAGTAPRSILFLTATVVAALFAGLAAASGSRYLAWMDERARRLATERDQQAAIAAAAERTRIARELHDIVSHSLSVVITLADAAAVVSRSDPGREAMAEVSETGRQALSDMRAMLGVLRTDRPSDDDVSPQPGVGQLGALVERVRATGLAVEFGIEGTPFPLGAAAGLTVYRIVQEALTNTIRHASASQARVTIWYDEPRIRVAIADNGTSTATGEHHGHGIEGMRERAALHDGTVAAGPAPEGGWLVSAALHPGSGLAAA
jgi:signal transduction histidine kinase